MAQKQTVETVASMVRIEFNFPTEQQEQEYINSKHYRNCTIAGIKLDSKNNIYVSLPRWKQNCPVTLAKFNVTNGKLDAFPSWEWNTRLENVTDGLQSVLGFEIDAQDRMWILDQGKMFGQAAQNGSIKLLVWDLKNNDLFYRYQFTEHEAPLRTSFLNGIVVSSDNIAYISDSGLSVDPNEPMNPALIYFDVADSIIKRLLARTISTLPDTNVTFSVNGKECFGPGNPMLTGVDGVALTCDGQRLYWTPLTSRNLYAIDTDILQMYNEDDSLIEKAVIDLGEKTSVSDGLACTSRHELLITALENDTIYQVNENVLAPYVAESENAKITKRLPPGQLAKLMSPIANDSMIIPQLAKMIWPDTIGISSDHYMYFVTNDLCAFLTDSMNFEGNVPNFYIYRVKLLDRSKSYVFGCEYEKTQLGFIEWFLIVAGAMLYTVTLVAILIYTIRKTRKQQYQALQE